MKQLRIDGYYDEIMKSEARIQQEIVIWFRNNYCLLHSEPRCVIFSVPNEGMDIREQRKKIATGLMAGVSDLIVVLPDVVLFIEVKDDRGTQKPKQKDFEEIVKNLGYNYHIVRSLEDFQKIIYSFIRK